MPQRIYRGILPTKYSSRICLIQSLSILCMSAACGKTYLRNKTGTIQTPRFIAAYRYGDRHQCDWTIRAPPGHVVALEIEKLNWHPTPSCYYHNLTIRNKKILIVKQPAVSYSVLGNSLQDEFCPLPINCSSHTT